NGGTGGKTVLVSTAAGAHSLGSGAIKKSPGFDKNTFSGDGTPAVTGNLTIDDGARGSLTTPGQTPAATITAGGIRISAGAGSDGLTTTGTVNVTGDVSTSFGSGGSSMQWAANSKIGGKFSLRATAGNLDNVLVTSPSSFAVAGAVTI